MGLEMRAVTRNALDHHREARTRAAVAQFGHARKAGAKLVAVGCITPDQAELRAA